jgi:adenylosuccinate lyase
MIERYSLPEMAAVWDEEVKIALWVKIEVEAVKAWAKLGRVPSDAAARIEERAAVDIDRMRELERETHHDVIAFLKALGENVGEDAHYVHMGMTSSDILDTTTAVQISRSGRMILEALDALTEAVGELALEHRGTPIIGRTHGVHAEPMSLGVKFAYWWDELSRAGDALALAVGGASVGKLSGAVGTYANIDPRVEEMVCKALGIRAADVSSQIVSRDRHASYLNALAVLGSVMARHALEIRLLARTETSEILEGFAKKQKGSSAMPHKKNPIKCEQLCGLARLLRANAVAGMEDIELWHERDISHSSVERVILPDSSIIAHYMTVRLAQIVRSLDVRPERMLENLGASRELVFSGTVLTRLVEAGMSRDEAYDRVQAAAMEARQTGESFRDTLSRDATVTGLLGSDGMDDAFDLERHTRHAQTVFDRLGLTGDGKRPCTCEESREAEGSDEGGNCCGEAAESSQPAKERTA